MEWVETIGRSLDEAKQKALAQLGVAESDAEIEVLAEAKMGLFGRLRSEARVRARVRPTVPRARNDGKVRRRRRESPRPEETSAGGSPVPVPEEQQLPIDSTESSSDLASRTESRRHRTRRKKGKPQSQVEREDSAVPSQDEEAITLDAQGKIAEGFVAGLLRCLEVDASVTLRQTDDETLEVAVDGNELGFLIGPRGATLAAMEELTRTVVRRWGAPKGRLNVDVAGYREKRREALEAFAREAADEVIRTGTEQVLEPMSAADRRIVHDSVGQVEGVATRSEGEDPLRRVVLFKEDRQAS